MNYKIIHLKDTGNGITPNIYKNIFTLTIDDKIILKDSNCNSVIKDILLKSTNIINIFYSGKLHVIIDMLGRGATLNESLWELSDRLDKQCGYYFSNGNLEDGLYNSGYVIYDIILDTNNIQDLINIEHTHPEYFY